MGEVRAKAAVRRRTGNGVTIDTGNPFEYFLPFSGDVIWRRQLCFLTLFFDPGVEVCSRLDVDAQKHLRVLSSAVLSALAQIKAGLVRLDPHPVGMVRNQISLARQSRHPPAVIRICGIQLEERGRRMVRIAYRDVKLIRGHHIEARVAILPPELVADDGDVDRARWPAVARNRTRVIRTGIIVHASSTCRLP